MKKEQSLFCPGSAEKIPSLGEHLVVAIDLGFSKSRSSCGVAWQDGTCSKMRVENFMFGEALEKVREIISEHKEKESILIIEAPLSGVFSRSGNPVERGYFEKRNRNQAVSANRYWYSGPGAATCLAAVFFLRELSAVLSQKCRKVYLYEGFLTGEQKTGNH
jgi:hypothetical protein